MSLEAIRKEMFSYQHVSSEYAQKMLHKVPQSKTVDRVGYILAACKGKTVLNIGCSSGTLHSQIEATAKKAYGVDKELSNISNFLQIDVEKGVIPTFEDVEIVVAGEVLEHLSNAGAFLTKLGNYKCPILITVPNAFAEAGRGYMKRGTENVNADHVAFYSYTTMLTLLTRHSLKIEQFFWYNGQPYFAEGMIFVVRKEF